MTEIKTHEDFGIIIHYGLYSWYGYDHITSLKRRSVQNGSEWYLGRLIEKNSFRPISGHKYTKDFHVKNYPDTQYFDNIDKIIEDKKKIKEWVRLAKLSKATHVILTSKHHEGLCLWDTSTTDRKSKLDICEVFSKECRRQHIDFGFYYSWFEFDKPFTVNYFNNYCIPQLLELCKYKPKYMWFDGQWKIKQKIVISKIKEIILKMKGDDIIVNDRIGEENISLSDYRVFSDRFIPEEKLDEKWQHVNTIGYSWGYCSTQEKSDYKLPENVFTLYSKIKGLGGSLLLNIGPDKFGDVVQNEKEVLEYFSSI